MRSINVFYVQEHPRRLWKENIEKTNREKKEVATQYISIDFLQHSENGPFKAEAKHIRHAHMRRVYINMSIKGPENFAPLSFSPHFY